MILISEVLTRKAREVWSIDPRASVFDALALMAQKDVGALPVVRDGRLVGMFSERDYARNVALRGRSSRTTPVQELMSSPVVCIRPDQTVHEAMAIVTEQRLRHLPVVEQDHMIGLVSIGDLVKEVIADQEQTIKQLESYIHS